MKKDEYLGDAWLIDGAMSEVPIAILSTISTTEFEILII